MEKIAPVLRDLPRSYRESNWKLHMPAVWRTLPLCFAFNRVNYKRWLSLYHEDCLALPKAFPIVYSALLEGDFTVKHTVNSVSRIPLDQYLEKGYDKSAKGPSWIIGYTRKNVLKWNINIQRMSNTRSILFITNSQMLKGDEMCVSPLVNYIAQWGNSFNTENQCLRNLATESQLQEKKFLIKFLKKWIY